MPGPPWAKARLRLGLWAALGAGFSCAFIPLIRLANHTPFLVYVAIEAVFLLISRRKWTKLNVKKPSLQLDAEARRREAWTCFSAVLRGMDELELDCRDWLSNWFRGADCVAAIRHDDCAELLAATVWLSSR